MANDNHLSFVTGFIEEQAGVASDYCNYMNTQTKNPFEIEHIITDHYGWFTSVYTDQENFQRWKNKLLCVIITNFAYNMDSKVIIFND